MSILIKNIVNKKILLKVSHNNSIKKILCVNLELQECNNCC